MVGGRDARKTSAAAASTAAISMRVALPAGTRSAASILLGRQLLEGREQELPEAIDRGDQHALVGRVRVLDLGAEGDHVAARELRPQDAALEARVDGLDRGRLAH